MKKKDDKLDRILRALSEEFPGLRLCGTGFDKNGLLKLFYKNGKFCCSVKIHE